MITAEFATIKSVEREKPGERDERVVFTSEEGWTFARGKQEAPAE